MEKFMPVLYCFRGNYWPLFRGSVKLFIYASQLWHILRWKIVFQSHHCIFLLGHWTFFETNFRGFIKFLCRRSVGFFSRAFLVFLMKESKKRRRKQPGKLMPKSPSQPVNLPGARPLMNPLNFNGDKCQANVFFWLWYIQCWNAS